MRTAKPRTSRAVPGVGLIGLLLACLAVADVVRSAPSAIGTPLAWGVDAGPPAAYRPVAPSSQGSSGPLDPNGFLSLGPLPAGSFTIDTDALTFGGLPGGVVQPQDFGPEIAVFAFDGGSVLANGDLITITGSRPVALLFQGDATLRGAIDASGADGSPQVATDPPVFFQTFIGGPGGAGGPGGGSGGKGGHPQARGLTGGGPGGGLGGQTSGGGAAGGAGGGGGGFGGGGGVGGNGSRGAGGGAGGSAYGDLWQALEGGSGGGGGGGSCCLFQNSGGGGGAGGGGGGLELGAAGQLVLEVATILARGGNGQHPDGWGGGGSGGGVLLHAFDVFLDAGTLVDASGGDGRPNSFGGCGAGGRVLIATNTSGQLDNQAIIDVRAGGFCGNLAAHVGSFETIADPRIGASANQPPVALCQDVTVVADGACRASANIDGGSFDLDGDPITVSQAPAGPYGLGDTPVELTVTDDKGASASCQATVTVVDQTPPLIQPNAAATITPPDAPIAFTATATDNCSVASVAIEGFDCYFVAPNGRRIDKTDSCVVTIDGDTITIWDSGGVGDNITWEVTAADASSNASATDVEVAVVKRGKGTGGDLP